MENIRVTLAPQYRNPMCAQQSRLIPRRHLVSKFRRILDARELPTGEDEVTVQEQGNLLESLNTLRQNPNGAACSEKVIEKGRRHAILVDHQQEFIELGTVDGPGIVAHDLRHCT